MTTLERFVALFGVEAGFQFIDVTNFNANPNNGGKLEGTGRDYESHDGKPDASSFNTHLNGLRALAIRGSLFGCIDIDPRNYESFDALSWIDDNAERIRRAHLVATVSKSGGVRLWRFMAERVSRTMIADDLLFWVTTFDTSGCDVEVFPEGARFITLCFFNNEDRTGRAVDQFVAVAEEYKRIERDLRYKNDGRLQFGDSRRQVEKGIVGFANLTEFLPLIDTPGAIRRYTFEYDGKPVIVDGIANLSKARKVKEEVATQAGTFIAGLTPRRWEKTLETLFESRRQDTYDDNVESIMLWAMNNEIARSFRLGNTQVTDPASLFLGHFAVWLEKDSRMLWYKGALMLNRLKKTGIVDTPTSRKLADITRATGGTVPKNGKHVPGYGTHKLHGLPCPDWLFDEIIDADESWRRPNVVGDLISTRIEVLRDQSHEPAEEKRNKFTRRQIQGRSHY